jgi:hypothetical protein
MGAGQGKAATRYGMVHVVHPYIRITSGVEQDGVEDAPELVA